MAWQPHRVSRLGRRVDTVMLSGNGGQKVYLVPSLDLIMAKVLLPALLR